MWNKEQLLNNYRYLHHYHCNHLNSELNRILTIKCSRETKKQKEVRLNKLFVGSATVSPSENIFEEITTNEKLQHLYKYMPTSESRWFQRLITFSENLPICVTVSSSRKSLRGFPLIYVNKRFEELTKYKRLDILGKNCKFLQPDTVPSDENLQYILMRNALEHASQISLILTNIKADGTPFQNLLSLVPIKDKNENFIYVVGVQTELNMVNLNIEDVQNVIDLISIVHDNIDGSR